jgi:hypothetical protein
MVITVGTSSTDCLNKEERMREPKEISICSKFDIVNFKNGDIKWIMYDSRDEAIRKQTEEELTEPTVLQHFKVVGTNDKGFVLELDEGIEVKFKEVTDD